MQDYRKLVVWQEAHQLVIETVTETADFQRFLTRALGSANEVEYDLLLARDLGVLSESAHRRLASRVAEIRRMLSGLMRRLAGNP